MSPSPPDDSELVEWLCRLRAGDPAAPNGLLSWASNEYECYVSRMLSRFPRLRWFEQTGDVLNAVLIRLRAALAKVCPESPDHFKALVHRHTVWALRDMHRSLFGPSGIGTNQDGGGLPPGDDGSRTDGARQHDGPPELAAWTEFHEAVERLPDDQRLVFDLLWYQGATQAQAAAVLGIDVRVVRRLWREACRALKPHLPFGDAGFGDADEPPGDTP